MRRIALLGGHIDVAIMTPSSALSQLQSGDIRLLGMSSARRNEYFPQVPTFKEQGYDVVESIWRSVMVKAGTPQAGRRHADGGARQDEADRAVEGVLAPEHAVVDVAISLDGMQKQVAR